MKKALSVILALVMILAIIPLGSVLSSATDEIPEGYTPIYTVEDLYCVRNNLSGNYILMNDIDLTEATAEGGDWDVSGRGWNPIGSNDEYSNLSFTGIFDGNGYSITGMRIDIDEPPRVTINWYVGLFSSVEGVIKNLSLSNIELLFNNHDYLNRAFIGGIAAQVKNAGQIINCHVDGIIDIDYHVNKNCDTTIYAGGICSITSLTTNTVHPFISACSSNLEMTVNRTSESDGGYFHGGTVCGLITSSSKAEKCYGAGSVSITSNNEYKEKMFFSGICEVEKSSELTDSFSKTDIDGDLDTTNMAGIAYTRYNGGNPKITRCYNVGIVNGVAINSDGSAIVEKCYCLTSGCTEVGHASVITLTSSQAQIQSLFSSFDFDNVWIISKEGEYHYPQLRENLVDKPCIITGHEYRTKVDVAPTCTEPGAGTKTCIYCGKTVQGEIEPLGHTPETEWRTTILPTCTEDGEKILICSVCEDIIQTKKIDKKGHTPGEWQIIESATCTQTGKKLRYCAVCGDLIETKTIPAKGHSFYDTIVSASCTEKGYTKHTCSDCGYEYSDSYVSALGHTAGAWIITREPTCTTEGLKVRYCTTCNEIVSTQSIPTKSHSYNDRIVVPTCTEKGYTKHTCSDCGYEFVDTYIAALGHTKGTWEIIKEATYNEAGEKVRKCTVCGEVLESESIPKLIRNGWFTENGKTYYYDNDVLYKSKLAIIDGKKYYFGSDGAMYVKKLISVSGKKYYVGADGVAYTKKLISYNGKKYYLGADGVAYTSKLISVSGNKYYMGSDGAAYMSKLATVSGKKYYFGKDGVAYKSKLISVSGKKYYIGKDCIAYKSKFASLSGVKYYFGSDCVMYKSKTFSVSGVKWKADSNGVCKKV